MDPSTTLAAPGPLLDQELDALGSQPVLNIYTQLSHFYRFDGSSASRERVVTVLQNGLSRLAESFPFVAGKVVNTGASATSAGRFAIRRHRPAPELVVRDLTNDDSAPTLASLTAQGFPARLVTESAFSRRDTFPDGSQDQVVFAVQANFLKDGLILTFSGAHNCMDMMGQGQIITLLHKACRGEPFEEQELREGNRDRRTIFPLLEDSWQPTSELDNVTIPAPGEKSGAEAPPGETPSCSWRYFTLSAAALENLKILAGQDLSVPYVSTDDAVTAFIWLVITRARAYRLAPDSEVKMTRALDARPYLGVSPFYTGVLQNMTNHRFPLSEMLSMPLGVLASDYRKALNDKDLIAQNTRAIATALSRSALKTEFSFTAKLTLAADIMLSSWSKTNGYELDFGMGLGDAVSVRRPSFMPVESLIYLMPKDRDGSIAVLACLRDADWDRVKEDKAFRENATLNE